LVLVGVGRSVAGVVEQTDGARTFAPHSGCMPLDRRIHRPVVGVLQDRDLKAERPQCGTNERHVIVRVLERSDLGVVDLISNQQSNACFCPHLRRQQSNQQSNDCGPQHVRRPGKLTYPVYTDRRLVVVPAGHFNMGSPVAEEGRLNDEGPQHEVTIAKSFAVGRFAITRGEYATFVRETKHAPGDKCRTLENGKWEERSGRSFRNPGFTQEDRHPVVCVNWEDAKDFAAWLSKMTGQTYRLLSEAEREYATRAGSTTRYSFGEEARTLCAYGNVADQTAKRTINGAEGWIIADCDDGYAYTAPVGQFAANAFGIYDVLGNVWEWTEDCWNENYQGTPTDGSAWSLGDCGKRAVRGGYWGYNDRDRGRRSASRGWWVADKRSSGIGLRVARTLHP
jgi:formylglycine-generating enzyme required for sulfatase activity